MALRDDDGNAFSDEYLKYFILNFILAGRDTTSNALSWAMFELCTHPDVQRKVQEEVDGVLAGSPPDFESVKGLKYLDRVIHETLRYDINDWSKI